MFTAITYQDWLAKVQAGKMQETILQAISLYRSSSDFKAAQEADGYYTANKTAIDNKVLLQAKKVSSIDDEGNVKKHLTNEEIVGNRVSSNFFRRFIDQENNFLLGNGITLADEQTKKKLGAAFDKKLSLLGKKALVHGVAWGYWNVDHIEAIPAYTDGLSGAFALYDEMTGEPGVFIQFWQLDGDRPQYIRLFEADGVTVYCYHDSMFEELQPKRPYVIKMAVSAIGTEVTGSDNYPTLPIVPLYANDEKRSELTKSLKSKIDLYDRIASDFGDNLDRSNLVYWVLNNFPGNIEDVVDMMENIRKLGVVVNQTDGTGSGATAEPKTIDVPYQARQVALGILKKELYSDAMALDMDEITGGSLTNVAIKAAMTNLNLT